MKRVRHAHRHVGPGKLQRLRTLSKIHSNLVPLAALDAVGTKREVHRTDDDLSCVPTADTRVHHAIDTTVVVGRRLVAGPAKYADAP